jgi:hypothetical protein
MTSAGIISCSFEEVLVVKIIVFTPAGTPLSILDGVPIAVKDEIDCIPYPTTGKHPRNSLNRDELERFLMVSDHRIVYSRYDLSSHCGDSMLDRA